MNKWYDIEYDEYYYGYLEREYLQLKTSKTTTKHTHCTVHRFEKQKQTKILKNINTTNIEYKNNNNAVERLQSYQM